jgi:hypothetical protein
MITARELLSSPVAFINQPVPVGYFRLWFEDQWASRTGWYDVSMDYWFDALEYEELNFKSGDYYYSFFNWSIDFYEWSN